MDKAGTVVAAPCCLYNTEYSAQQHSTRSAPTVVPELHSAGDKSRMLNFAADSTRMSGKEITPAGIRCRFRLEDDE